MLTKKILTKSNVIIAVLCTLLIVLLCCFYISNKSANQVVAVVGNESISSKELTDYLYAENAQIAVEALIDKSLIEQEAKELNISEPDSETAIRQLQYIQLFNPQHTSIGNVKTKEFVDMYFKVKSLAEKYTITDKTLEVFLAMEQEQNGDNVIDVVVLTGAHEQIMNAASQISEGNDYSEVAKEQGLSISNSQMFAYNNEYGQDFTGLRVGEYLHIMPGDNSEANLTNHKLIIVKKINNIYDELFNLDINRELIQNVYMSKNYAQERINVSQYLRMKYNIAYEMEF